MAIAKDKGKEEDIAIVLLLPALPWGTALWTLALVADIEAFSGAISANVT